MLTLKTTNRFDKELIQAVKSGKDTAKIREVIKKLVNVEPYYLKSRIWWDKGSVKKVTSGRMFFRFRF